MHEIMKLTVRSLYDIQKLRIEMGNRLSAQVRDGVLTKDWEDRARSHHKRLEEAENEIEKDLKKLLSDIRLLVRHTYNIRIADLIYIKIVFRPKKGE